MANLIWSLARFLIRNIIGFHVDWFLLFLISKLQKKQHIGSQKIQSNGVEVPIELCCAHCYQVENRNFCFIIYCCSNVDIKGLIFILVLLFHEISFHNVNSIIYKINSPFYSFFAILVNACSRLHYLFLRFALVKWNVKLQMGSNFKSNVLSEHVQKATMNWYHRAVNRNKNKSIELLITTN